MHLSCNFKSCFNSLNSREGTIQQSVFICLKESCSLTSLFVGEFLWFFKRHKITILNLTAALYTDFAIRILTKCLFWNKTKMHVKELNIGCEREIEMILGMIWIYQECEDGIENLSWGSPFGITRLIAWWKTVIKRDRFFYPILTQITDFFLLTLKYCIFMLKMPPEIFGYAEMQHNMIMSL